MTRNNILFAVFGAILGLIAGSLFVGPLLMKRNLIPAVTAGAETSASPSAVAPPDPNAQAMGAVMQQINLLKQQIEQNPNDVAAAVQLGNMYMDARKYDQAISYYDRALSLQPNPDVRTDLGICYRAKGESQKALEIFQSIRKEHPDHWPARFNEAVALVDLKRYDEARAIVAAMKKERPDDRDVQRFEQVLAQVKG